MSPIVPKREKGPDGAGRTRSIWADDDLWEDLQLAAKREGYSVSKFVHFLLLAGFAEYRRERALEKSEKTP